MAYFIGNIGEYKEGKEDFESYLERFEQWMIVNEVEQGKKANVFLSISLWTVKKPLHTR